MLLGDPVGWAEPNRTWMVGGDVVWMIGPLTVAGWLLGYTRFIQLCMESTNPRRARLASRTTEGLDNAEVAASSETR